MPRVRPEFYFDGTYYRKRKKMPDGTYKDVRAKTKDELRAKLYDMETANRLSMILDDKTTVAELSAQWYENRKDGLSFSRRRDYANAINNHICPVIGALRVGDVRPENCQRIMAKMAGKSQSLQSKVLGVMKNIFTCAQENGIIYRVPCATIKPRGVKTEEKVALAAEQVDKLLAAVKGSRAEVFVSLGLYAGLRREEICGLRWSDVVLTGGAPCLTVNHAVRFENSKGIFPSKLKNKAAHRTIPIPVRLVELLVEEKKKSSSVFVAPAKDGGNANLQTVRNIMKYIERRTITEEPASKEGEREKKRGPQITPTLDFRVTPHQLRHTYITNLCKSGLDIKKIQYLAGHATVKMTLEVYSHVVEQK